MKHLQKVIKFKYIALVKQCIGLLPSSSLSWMNFSMHGFFQGRKMKKISFFICIILTIVFIKVARNKDIGRGKIVLEHNSTLESLDMYYFLR